MSFNDIRSLEVFYWVWTLGSFRKAAEYLNTTQPAVSQRISTLEESFGVRFLERSNRQIALTPKGRELLDFAEGFLNLRTEMVRKLAKGELYGGRVRIGVSETIVHTWLARFVERVAVSYPSVIIDISVDVSNNLANSLINREIDLAFLLGPVGDPRVTNHDLCRYPLAFVARPGFDLGPEPVTLPTLLSVPIITYPTTTRPYVALREKLQAANLPQPRIYSNSSLSTIIKMTLDGIGISVIPPIAIEQELAEGKLRIVSTDIELPSLFYTVSLAHTPGDFLPEALSVIAREIAMEDGKTASAMQNVLFS